MKSRLAAGLLLAGAGTGLHAEDTFIVTALTTDELPALNVTVGKSNFSDLVQAAVEGTGEFSVLLDRESTSVLEYAGAGNAMRFDINAAGTRAVLDIPSIDFKRTFIASSRKALYQQIKDFLQNEGDDVYRRFLKAMNAQALVAVSDGNPNSTTAVTAREIFEGSGFGGTETISRALETEDINLSLLINVGQFSAGNIDGRNYSLPLGYTFKINERVSTQLRATISYIDTEGASIWNGAFIVNVPVKVLISQPKADAETASRTWVDKVNWTLTPTAGIAAGGSQDGSTQLGNAHR